MDCRSSEVELRLPTLITINAAKSFLKAKTMTLAIRPAFNLPANQADLVQKTMDYEQASLSPNTLRSYTSMCRKFQAWCEANHQPFLPTSAETLALYLASLGESVSFSTLDSTIAAIEAAHEKVGMTIKGDAALYRRVRRGIRRTHKGNQTLKQASAMTVLDLKVACCKLGESLKDSRDRALLTLAFFGAFRRSEVVSLDLEHLKFNDKGVTVSLLQSKTSDSKQVIYVAYAKDKDICPVRALQDWIEKAQLKEGAIFCSLLKGGKLARRLSGHAVSEIIKNHFGSEYSGHSARRGLVTASAEKGTALHVIKKHSRHKSADMVLRYIDDAKGFEDSAVSVLGI
jgi:site-specific recombinase XerD